MLDPLQEGGPFCGGNAGGLMSEVGADVAVGKNNLAVVQRGFEFRLGFETVAGVEQGREMRIDAFERAEVTVEELADHFSEPGIVLREARGKDGMAESAELGRQEIDLCALAAAIDAFDGD
jgi:hypothetical protein